ncbi:MAG: glycosyltransferase family 4 protein [Kangiellaceae bacterium]|nr:glycosyltransferase family 4 protein [Kangiellaceae bacterium]
MNSSKKVVLVANAAFTITNFRSELIGEFISRGYKVVVACPESCLLSGQENVSDTIGELGAKHYAIPLSRSGINPFSEIKLFLSLQKLFKKEDPEIVLNYTIKPTVYGSIAAKSSCRAKVFSTITGLGYLFTSNSLKSKILGFVVKLQYFIAFKLNHTLFFQNNDDLELLQSIGLLKNVRTKIVNGSGVNLTTFKSTGRHKRPKSFLMIGRILKDKGIDEYISAARKLKIKHSDVLFQVLGPLDENPAAYGLSDINKWQKEGTIEYISPKKDVRPFLEAAEVFVLPSYREGTPRSTLEAMAMGLPVITTNAPGCKETVEDGVNGFVVKVKDSNKLAEAMEKFIVEDKLASRMGLESLRVATDKYDVAKVNQAILSTVIG